MANEKQVRTGQAVNSPVPTTNAVQQSPTLPLMPSIELLSPQQFNQLLRAQIYAAILGGYLARGGSPTATATNLRNIKDYGDAVMEMVNAD